MCIWGKQTSPKGVFEESLDEDDLTHLWSTRGKQALSATPCQVLCLVCQVSWRTRHKTWLRLVKCLDAQGTRLDTAKSCASRQCVKSLLCVKTMCQNSCASRQFVKKSLVRQDKDLSWRTRLDTFCISWSTRCSSASPCQKIKRPPPSGKSFLEGGRCPPYFPWHVSIFSLTHVLNFMDTFPYLP